MILTCLSKGCNLVKHMTMASIRVRSVYDSKALTRMRSKDLISESVTDLAIQPYTMMALGCKAGLYWNENLKEKESQR